MNSRRRSRRSRQLLGHVTFRKVERESVTYRLEAGNERWLITNLPEFLQLELRPVVELMRKKGWQRLEIPLDPDDNKLPLADRVEVKTKLLRRQSVLWALGIAVWYMGNVGRQATKEFAANAVRGQIASLDFRVGELEEKLSEIRLRHAGFSEDIEKLEAEIARMLKEIEVVIAAPEQLVYVRSRSVGISNCIVFTIVVGSIPTYRVEVGSDGLLFGEFPEVIRQALQPIVGLALEVRCQFLSIPLDPNNGERLTADDTAPFLELLRSDSVCRALTLAVWYLESNGRCGTKKLALGTLRRRCYFLGLEIEKQEKEIAAFKLRRLPLVAGEAALTAEADRIQAMVETTLIAPEQWARDRASESRPRGHHRRKPSKR